jgi:hypothetical protein
MSISHRAIKGCGCVGTSTRGTNRIHVFGDESGNTGFDSLGTGGKQDHFIFAFVVTQDVESMRCAAEEYHRYLANKGRGRVESKIKKMRADDAKEWFTFLGGLPLDACALVVNKAGLLRKDRPPSNEAYQHFLYWGLDAHRGMMTTSEIVMDEINSSKQYELQVKAFLRQHLNSSGPAVFEDFSFETSRNNRGVQVAHGFCDALKCAVMENDDRFLSMLRNKLPDERIVWR